MVAVRAVTDVLPNAGALTNISDVTDALPNAGALTNISDVTDALPDAGALTSISAETDKIDAAVTDGLDGVYDSLAYRVSEIEKHFHGREYWWGALAAPDTTNAIELNVTRPFVAASGANVWGVAIPVIGSADLPTHADDVYWDPHRILVTDLDDETDAWLVRWIWGTGTVGDAITAGQFTEVMVQSNAVPGNRAGGQPFAMQCPRIAAGTNLWAQVWNDTNLEEMSFFIGLHGYEG